MRRRLLLSMLAITVATVAVFGIPLAFVLQRVVHDDAHSRLERDATRVASQLSQPDVQHEPTNILLGQLRRDVPPEDGVDVEFADGHHVATAHAAHTIQATVAGPRGTAVTVASPVDDVNDRVQRALMELLAL